MIRSFNRLPIGSSLLVYRADREANQPHKCPPPPHSLRCWSHLNMQQHFISILTSSFFLFCSSLYFFDSTVGEISPKIPTDGLSPRKGDGKKKKTTKEERENGEKVLRVRGKHLRDRPAQAHTQKANDKAGRVWPPPTPFCVWKGHPPPAFPQAYLLADRHT